MWQMLLQMSHFRWSSDLANFTPCLGCSRPGGERYTRSNLSRPLTNKQHNNDAIRDVIIISKVGCYVINCNALWSWWQVRTIWMSALDVVWCWQWRPSPQSSTVTRHSTSLASVRTLQCSWTPPSDRRTYLSDGGGIHVVPFPLPPLRFLGLMILLEFPILLPLWFLGRMMILVIYNVYYFKL